MMLGLSRAAVAVAALVCVAMSPLSADPADKAFVVIGTGGPSGVYFAAGNSI